MASTLTRALLVALPNKYASSGGYCWYNSLVIKDEIRLPDKGRIDSDLL